MANKVGNGYLWKISVLLMFPCSVFSLKFLDPINWPKQIALVSVLPILAFEIFSRFRSVFGFDQRIKTLVRIYSISFVLLLIPVLLNFGTLTRTLWGTWGRNNGFVTTLSLMLVSFFTAFLSLVVPNFRTVFLKAISLCFIPASIYGLIQASGNDPVSWSNTDQVFSFFGNTNFASSIFALSAGASLFCFSISSNKFEKGVYLLQGLVSSILVFQTESIQGQVLLALFIFIFTFLRLREKYSSAALAYLAFGALGGVFLLVSFLGFGPIGNLLFQYTLKLRSFYWLAGLETGINNLLVGVGVDSFGDFYREFRSAEAIQATTIDLTVDNAHNTLIQYFATLGLFGSIAYLVIFGIGLLAVIATLLSKSRKVETPDSAVSALFLGSFLTSMISIDNIAVAILGWSLSGVALGFGVQRRFDSRRVGDSDLLRSDEDGSKTKTKQRNSKTSSNLDNLRPLIVTASTLLVFAFTWGASSADRSIYRLYGLALSQREAMNDVSLNEMYNLGLTARFVQESQFDYLIRAMELSTKVDPLALNVASRALEQFPRDFRLLDRYSVIAERLGRFEEASKARVTQLEIEPRHPRVWAYYANDLAELGKIEKSRQAIARARNFASEFKDDSTLDYVDALDTKFNLSN